MKILEQILEEIEKKTDLAHEEMSRCASENPLQFDDAKGYARGIGTAIDIIRSHMGDDGWIPVDESIPEYYGTVWLSFTNQHSSYSRMAYWDGRYFRWCSNGIKVKDSPVAWKPFCAPEPYHPKEE